MFEIITIKLNDHDRWTYHTPKKKKKNHQFVVRTLDSLVNYIFLYNIHVFFFFFDEYILHVVLSLLDSKNGLNVSKKKKRKRKRKRERMVQNGFIGANM